MEELVVDPVCGMRVRPGHYSVEFLGMSYSFCSQQCQERFLANPRLYIGVPGKKAPGNSGMEVLKRRRLRLEQTLSASEADKLVAALQQMMGIHSVLVDGNCVSIDYDLLQATAEQIEEKLMAIGIQLGGGWGGRLRRAFVHYEEDCEIGSLEVNPKIPGHRH